MGSRRSSYLALVFAIVAFAWTEVGESSTPMLSAGELPVNIVSDCYSEEVCDVNQSYIIHWLNKTATGNLFLVIPSSCDDASGCGAWLVEKCRQHTLTLLTLDGMYRLNKSTNAYPDVEVKKEVSDTEIEYSRFSWQSGEYTKIVSKEVYRVDGVECGTEDECHATALKAINDQRMGQAVKILETVHNVSWI